MKMSCRLGSRDHGSTSVQEPWQQKREAVDTLGWHPEKAGALKRLDRGLFPPENWHAGCPRRRRLQGLHPGASNIHFLEDRLPA